MAAAVRLLLVLLLLSPPPILSRPCLPAALRPSPGVLRVTCLCVGGLLLLSLCPRPERDAAACLCGGPLGGVVLRLVVGGSGSLGGGQSLRAGQGRSSVAVCMSTNVPSCPASLRMTECMCLTWWHKESHASWLQEGARAPE